MISTQSRRGLFELFAVLTESLAIPASPNKLSICTDTICFSMASISARLCTQNSSPFRRSHTEIFKLPHFSHSPLTSLLRRQCGQMRHERANMSQLGLFLHGNSSHVFFKGYEALSVEHPEAQTRKEASWIQDPSGQKGNCGIGAIWAIWGSGKGINWEKGKGGIVDNVGGHCSTADFLHREKGSECRPGKHNCLDMSFPLEEERYQLTTVQRRGNVIQGENNEEAYDGKKQFKAWRRAVLLRLGEKGLEGAIKPVNEHYRMVHEDNVTALQSKGKDVPKYMWLWEELYGDGEKVNEIEEEESVREVTRKEREETEVRSPSTMKQSTPSIADKRTSTRLKEAVERLRKEIGEEEYVSSTSSPRIS
eukprot:g69802.t1